jgi:RNA polymerase sigma-70 factor (ECF subfamily)
MSRQDELYEEASTAFGGALERLARAYEMEPDKCRDLIQEIHIALWRSFEKFDGRCSLRTWVYRVAHNVAVSLITRRRTVKNAFLNLEEVEVSADSVDLEVKIDRKRAFDRLFELIRELKPSDRQVILLYLEGLDATSIGEITGLPSSHVTTKVYRIKKLLSRRFPKGGSNVS